MRIDHTAMYVQNLEKMREFFITYFKAESNEGYHNPVSGLRTYFLSFSDGARLEIMNRPDMEVSSQSLCCTGYVHLAFAAGSRQNVDELTERLKKDGYEILSGPRVTGDGYYESCVLGPEDSQIEITV